MKIDLSIINYEFHLMRIKRTPYKKEPQVEEHHKDLYILNGEVVDWWRKEGHNLYQEDIQPIIDAKPDALIVGTGNPGMLKVFKELQHLLLKKEIPLIVAPTEWAVKIYNSLRGDGNIAAAFHLTC